MAIESMTAVAAGESKEVSKGKGDALEVGSGVVSGKTRGETPGVHNVINDEDDDSLASHSLSFDASDVSSLDIHSIVADFEHAKPMTVEEVTPAKPRFEQGSELQKSVALDWLNVFIRSGQKQITNLFPEVLRCLLFAMNDPRLKSKAVLLNSQLLSVTLRIATDSPESVNLEQLMDVLVRNLDSNKCNSETHIAILQWMNSLFVDLSIVDSGAVRLDELLSYVVCNLILYFFD